MHLQVKTRISGHKGRNPEFPKTITSPENREENKLKMPKREHKKYHNERETDREEMSPEKGRTTTLRQNKQGWGKTINN